MTLRTDGIDVKGESFTRETLSRCAVENGHLVVYRLGHRGRTGGDKGVPLSGVPNCAVLLELLSDKGYPT